MAFIGQLHPWRVSVGKAIEIQEELRGRGVSGEGPRIVKKVAGVDVGYSDRRIVAAICVFRWSGAPMPKHGSGLDHLETVIATSEVSFPYVPGLLTFREGPVILKAFRKIKNKPDVILFDGQGICHPRRMGIATHLGIILDIPSIGCAKSSLCGIYRVPDKEKGSFSFIYDEKTGEKLGAVLRTRAGIKPIFVSPGYKINLRQCIDLVLRLCPKYRIPEPLRYAHREANPVRCFASNGANLCQ